MYYILISSIILILLSITIKLKKIPHEEEFTLLLIFISIISTIKINTGREFLEYNGESPLRISLSFITIFCLGILHISKIQKKKAINVCILIILINTLLWGMGISNSVKYYNFIELYADILLLYLIISNLKYISVNYVIKLVSIFAILNSILGIFQFITSKKLLIGAWSESIYFLQETGGQVKRIVGFAGTNNAAGNLGAILFCIALFNFSRQKKLRNFVWLVLSGIFSILTLTRIGYLAIFVQIGIFFVFNIKYNGISRRNKYYLIVLSIIVPLVVGIFFAKDIYQILVVNRGFTSDYRIHQFQLVIENVISKNFFIGVGPGQLNQYLLSNFSKHEMDLHSQYLNVLVEQGFIIFIIFVYFNVSIFTQCIKRHKDPLIRVFVTSLFITSLITFNYNPNQYYIINNLLYYIIMFSLLELNFTEKDNIGLSSLKNIMEFFKINCLDKFKKVR